jgi:hypothetical protein
MTRPRPARARGGGVKQRLEPKLRGMPEAWQCCLCKVVRGLHPNPGMLGAQTPTYGVPAKGLVRRSGVEKPGRLGIMRCLLSLCRCGVEMPCEQMDALQTLDRSRHQTQIKRGQGSGVRVECA